MNIRKAGRPPAGKERGMEQVEEVYIGVRNWWSYLVTGLLLIAFGIILLAWPASTIKVLAYLAGILFLLVGLVDTILAFVLLARREKMAVILIRGLVGLLIGILLLAKTGFTLTLVVVFIAIWSIIAGFIEIVAGQEMPPKTGKGWVIAGGVINMILGILLLALPLQTVYAIIILLSIFLLVHGLVRLVMAFLARRLQKELLAA